MSSFRGDATDLCQLFSCLGEAPVSELVKVYGLSEFKQSPFILGRTDAGIINTARRQFPGTAHLTDDPSSVYNLPHPSARGFGVCFRKTQMRMPERPNRAVAHGQPQTRKQRYR